MIDTRRMVGRITDAGSLGGGAKALLVACRKAGGWFSWATAGTITKPVKIVAAKESGDGKAVFEDRPFERVLVKGRHHDGRRFVVQYVDSKAETAYVLSHHHEVTLEDGHPWTWRTERPYWRSASVSEVKTYIGTEKAHE